jgi:cobalt-zinc-cadmium efflux system membrane fusion protein
MTFSRKTLRALSASALTVVVLACAPQGTTERSTDVHADDVSSHTEEESTAAIHIEPEDLGELGVIVAAVASGSLQSGTELPGQVRVNGDDLAHVTPRVGGVVREVKKSLGDPVRKGELLAFLDSRELADLKAEYLAAATQLSLAQASFNREERLWKDKVSSEQDYLDAKAARSEARIELRSAAEKLLALGFEREQLDHPPNSHESSFTLYHLRSPLDGIIIDRHITQGESVEAEVAVFSVADLSSVWIDLDVYQKDLGLIRAGLTAHITTNHGHHTDLPISFVQPLVAEETRTALARIIAPNSNGEWHPGCFVTAFVITDTTPVDILVPRTAVVELEPGEPVVFVSEGHELVARTVKIGRGDDTSVEILSGLDAGERIAVRGAFTLKAELEKGSFGHGHAH